MTTHQLEPTPNTPTDLVNAAHEAVLTTNQTRRVNAVLPEGVLV